MEGRKERSNSPPVRQDSDWKSRDFRDIRLRCSKGDQGKPLAQIAGQGGHLFLHSGPLFEQALPAMINEHQRTSVLSQKLKHLRHLLASQHAAGRREALLVEPAARNEVSTWRAARRIPDLARRRELPDTSQGARKCFVLP